MTRLVIIGAATSLLEIIELIHDINASGKEKFEVLGAIDDNTALHGTTVETVKVLGGTNLAKTMDADVKFVFGIGSYGNRLRRIEIFENIGLPRTRYINLIHPSAKIYSTAKIGTGCIFYPGVLIMAHVQVGDFVIVFGNTVMAPLSHIDSFALFGSLVFLGSNSRIGSGAFLGSSSAIMEKTKVGPGAMIGIGSAVLKDVAAGATMLGNPARQIETTPVPEKLIAAFDKFAQQ